MRVVANRSCRIIWKPLKLAILNSARHDERRASLLDIDRCRLFARYAKRPEQRTQRIHRAPVRQRPRVNNLF